MSDKNLQGHTIFRCVCKAKFQTSEEFEAHRRQQYFSFDHYRVNAKGQEYKEIPKKAERQSAPTKIKSQIETQNKRVMKILAKAKLRVYLDIDEVEAVNIYVEGQEDERVFTGSYKTIDGAINAAYDALFNPNTEAPYISKAEQELCGYEI